MGYILFRPPVFFFTPVTNYMLLYRMLLCKNSAQAPGFIKDERTKLGGGETE